MHELPRKCTATARHGMTLIELLVVVAIIMLLAALTIPRLKPEMERSRIREAARSIQLYINSARNLAMLTGRSCGVMIERLPAEPGCSMALTQVETPPPYGGDSLASFATVSPSTNPPNNGYAYCDITLYSAPNVPMAPSVPLYLGDQIQIAYQGFWIILDERNPVDGKGVINGGANLKGKVDVSHGEVPAWTVRAVSGPFKILRWPVKSAASALQLPSPAAIDLTWSGVEPPLPTSSPKWEISTKPVTIVFSPNGTVDRIYTTSTSTGKPVYAAARVFSPIYLLVGRREKVINPPDPSKTDTNLNDFNSLWVSINPATGLIVVTDMAAQGTNDVQLNASRNFARQSNAMGGK
jgi:prepilin-type N-terminal cleavage/methylation domain-containing protein